MISASVSNACCQYNCLQCNKSMFMAAWKERDLLLHSNFTHISSEKLQRLTMSLICSGQVTVLLG